MDLWKQFVELATGDFHFLEVDFDFKLKSIKRPFITYESDKLRVDIYYDVDCRHELDLGVRKLNDDPHKPFSISVGMLMRLKDIDASEGYISPFPATEESLKAEVHRLAQLLQTYGANLLSGNMHDYERLQQIEQELARKFGAPRE